MSLSEAQLHRYSRQILLPEIDESGQEKLLRSRVLVVGAGGLGSPLLLYLSAAGVGTLGIVDDDVVELSNLQRQVIHTTVTLGQTKVESATTTMLAINPDIHVETYQIRLSPSNILSIIEHYDIVADGSDNFPTRFLVNDACFLSRKTLISAAVLRFDGQLTTFKSEGPCYRCLFPEPPVLGQQIYSPSCSEGGTLGTVTGVLGSLQGVEVIKEILGIGKSMAGILLIYNALTATFRRITVRQDPGCPLCGDTPVIKDLSVCW